jgi:hypothetical protein
MHHTNTLQAKLYFWDVWQNIVLQLWQHIVKHLLIYAQHDMQNVSSNSIASSGHMNTLIEDSGVHFQPDFSVTPILHTLPPPCCCQVRPPALVTEFMCGGSVRAALSRKADFLKPASVRVKLALDTARGWVCSCLMRPPAGIPAKCSTVFGGDMHMLNACLHHTTACTTHRHATNTGST